MTTLTAAQLQKREKYKKAREKDAASIFGFVLELKEDLRPCTEPSEAEIDAFRAEQSNPNFTDYKAQQDAKHSFSPK
jgi:hypothetical protein